MSQGESPSKALPTSPSRAPASAADPQIAHAYHHASLLRTAQVYLRKIRSQELLVRSATLVGLRTDAHQARTSWALAFASQVVPVPLLQISIWLLAFSVRLVSAAGVPSAPCSALRAPARSLARQLVLQPLHLEALAHSGCTPQWHI